MVQAGASLAVVNTFCNENSKFIFWLGIENAGPVAALEIMKEFPGNGIESLAKFKTWWDEAHEQVGNYQL